MNSSLGLGLVVATLGRIDPLDRLLASLRSQISPVDSIVVVAQGNHAAVHELAGRHGDLPILLGESERGAAHGRNLGVRLLPATASVLLFPNDSTWFPPCTLDAIRSAIDDGTRMAGLTVFDDGGPKTILPPPGSALNRLNVWRVMEVGLVVRRTDFEDLAGFDPLIGSGAPTPWQSGEVTDLLLRAMDRWPGLAREFAWLPRRVAVGGVREGQDLSDAERRRKVRAYGRGLGMIARRYRYPLGWRLARLLGGAGIGLLRRPDYELLDGLWAFTGRLEGMLGRTIGAEDDAAVTR